MVAVLNGKKKK